MASNHDWFHRRRPNGPALAQGFVSAGLASGRAIVAWDPVARGGRGVFKGASGREAGRPAMLEVVQQADVVFLAVKPQSMNGGV